MTNLEQLVEHAKVLMVVDGGDSKIAAVQSKDTEVSK